VLVVGSTSKTGPTPNSSGDERGAETLYPAAGFPVK